MQKITPCLWFKDQAEEAVNFYLSIFKDSRILKIMRYDEASAAASGMPAGSVLTISFELNGQEFIALNGGPAFNFTEAISFTINCETQQEVDRFWNALVDGGQKSQCGWLKDKYGLSWQVTPTILPKMLQDKNPQKALRVMKAMLEMEKIDIKKLKQAYDQK